ncbi:gastrula zinc finger protein XlCGF57.1-like [Aricia agestis]|uniref:gastrula zinc finger protein XlCGF57.1-like n=1 Tax=Aricia agestis TaxID=91739 RepID=UPI001C20A6A6|nr:gastrula zinc finger protein XlCGF57.1-like [Aricia agestis]
MSESNCNLCLAVNRRTINIMKTHLQLLYEKLANFKVSPDMSLCVCYVCHTRLRQCHQLSVMAKRSRCFLTTGLLQTNIKLKSDSMGLVNLSCSGTAHFTVPDPNSNSNNTVEVLVKKEPLISVTVEDLKFNIEDMEHYDDMDNTEDWHSDDAKKYTKKLNIGNDVKKHMACFKNKVEIEISALEGGIKEEILDREIKKEIVDDDGHFDPAVSTVLYTCRVCNHMFSTMSLLNKHKATHSASRLKVASSTKKVPCSICGKSYADKKTLNRHKRIHSDARPFACEVCGKGFTRRDHYNKHRQIHAEPRWYSCTDCGARFPSTLEFEAHECLPPPAEPSPSACDVCGEVFPRWDLYHRHKTDVHGIALFPDVTIERITPPTPPAPPAELYDPPAEADKQREIKKQKPPVVFAVKRRKKRDELSCDKCRIRFANKYRLQNHVLTKHRGVSYECDTCGKVFLRRANLGLHLRTHTGERGYCCDVCGKTFTYKSSLNVHRRVHSGDKPYACELCAKRFAAYGQLAEHKLVHSDVRAFACDVCGKSFKRRRHLKKHLTYHSGEKPYTCDVCFRSFTRNDNYTIHMRIHTGEKPFVCDVCGVTFSENRHLKKHKIVHE